MVSMIHKRRARCDRPSPQFEFQPEILDDFVRKEADEIGIARQTRVVIGEKPLRSCRPADVIVFLQQQYAQASTREISRSNKAVVTRPEDHNIISALDRAHARNRSPRVDAHRIAFT